MPVSFERRSMKFTFREFRGGIPPCERGFLELAIGTIYRGWARSASGDAEEGIARIEEGIRDYRATGATQKLPFSRALKAEAWHIANRASESVDTISEAQSLVERSGELYWYPEL